MSYYDTLIDGHSDWKFYTANASGMGANTITTSSYERRCNCPNKQVFSGVSTAWSDWYIAICGLSGRGDSWNNGTASIVEKWLRSNNWTCPKGWGKLKYRYPNDYYSVQYAQGYIADRSTPVYSTVTKYRDAYRNYITTRVAKA